MSSWPWARARLDSFDKQPPGRDILNVTEAIVFAAEDGDESNRALLNRVLDDFEWDPIKPKSVAKNQAYAPDMVVAGAIIALLAGDKRAKPYLYELAETFGSARRNELKAVGGLAAGVVSGEWQGEAKWTTFPTGFDEVYAGILKSSLDSALNILHTPHSFLFGKGIHYLLPLCMVGHIDADRGGALAAIFDRLGPGPSRRGKLLYRRAHEPPRRSDVLSGKASLGVAAIDMGKALHVYHDGFSMHDARWKFEADSPLAAALLQVDDNHWRQVESATSSAVWKTIDAARGSAVHILAVNPNLAQIADDERKRAEERFDVKLEVVPFIDT